MEGLRRTYGIAEPVRRGMELKIVRDGTFRPAVLGGNKGGNLHEDILVLGGRDTEVGWEDVFQGLLLLLCPLFCEDIIEANGCFSLIQETNSRSHPLSTTRWRSGCGWIRLTGSLGGKRLYYGLFASSIIVIHASFHVMTHQYYTVRNQKSWIRCTFVKSGNLPVID